MKKAALPLEEAKPPCESQSRVKSKVLVSDVGRFSSSSSLDLLRCNPRLNLPQELLHCDGQRLGGDACKDRTQEVSNGRDLRSVRQALPPRFFGHQHNQILPFEDLILDGRHRFPLNGGVARAFSTRPAWVQNRAAPPSAGRAEVLKSRSRQRAPEGQRSRVNGTTALAIHHPSRCLLSEISAVRVLSV
jgi:hypothetical protein